eukprot:CAMPEP_0179263070 /NCGR_PEP_ID=MMETSP0797-20121207/27691_1 /TAXON_ID=47934 /ORGANISM="Dinophysis acuminata, Strain DAEP01" /LENGTH=41 /DNA_ID= /DNA_START= /DNA_END= /DNA_ORIENTATION=
MLPQSLLLLACGATSAMADMSGDAAGRMASVPPMPTKRDSL